MKRPFGDMAGRVELSSTVTDGLGETTELVVVPRVLTMTSWSPSAWKDYHRGDKITIERRLGEEEWSFQGVVLHKRLGKITIGETRHTP